MPPSYRVALRRDRTSTNPPSVIRRRRRMMAATDTSPTDLTRKPEYATRIAMDATLSMNPRDLSATIERVVST